MWCQVHSSHIHTNHKTTSYITTSYIVIQGILQPVMLRRIDYTSIVTRLTKYYFTSFPDSLQVFVINVQVCLCGQLCVNIW